MRLLLAIICLSAFNSNAQLIVNNASPYWMVSSNFLGPDFTVSNVVYTGSYDAVGQFDGSGTNLGLNTGIILTTGTILDSGDGPQGPNNQGGAGIDNNVAGFALFDSISSYPTYNAAILEFDFIPSVDTLALKFVFGSEEYPEYVGATFNDPFGFFLFGPGIPGGYQNIAQLIGGEGPVSINNVNNGQNNSGPCQNCANYVHNGNGTESPYNGSNTYIQYDGFTQNTMAIAGSLIPGETYHLIIAIADMGDGILDSGLFIESCATCNYTIGVEEQVMDIKLYPNPAQDVLFIERGDVQNGLVTIQDSKGSVVLETSITGHKSELNITELNAGIYFVSVRSGDQVVRSKVVIN